jgi:hypothetical protein
MASEDIFGYKRNPKPRGVFSTEDSKLTFGAKGSPTEVPTDGGYLVQNWNINYQQNVEEVFEIGSNALYWSKGRPVGQGTLGRIIGDQDASAKGGHFFPKEAYDICEGGVVLVLAATGGHCEAAPSNVGGTGAATGVVLNKGVDVTMAGCLVTSVGFQMQVSNVRIMENMGWRFAFMQFN